MAKAKPVVKKAKKAMSHDHMPKKDFKSGDLVKTTRMVNGMDPGCEAAIKEAHYGGAVFVVEMITGPLHGVTLRIAAPDLTK